MEMEGTVSRARPGSLAFVIGDEPQWRYLIFPDELRKSGLGELKVGQRLLFEDGWLAGQLIATNLRPSSSPIPEGVAEMLKGGGKR